MTKRKIEINITLRCNWNCPCCVRLCDLKKDYYDSDMNINDITHICNEIKNVGEEKFDAIVLIGGEPTLNKDLIDICKYMKENLETKVRISSNGSNNSKYKKILDSIGMEIYTFAGKNTIRKKLDSHINFHISPFENKQQMKKDCGLNCGIGIIKIHNSLKYSFCSNQAFLSIMLQKEKLLKNSLRDILESRSDIDPLTVECCKHCQYLAVNKLKWNEGTVSKCFVDGISNYLNY